MITNKDKIKIVKMCDGGMTYEDAGKKYGVSKQRIAQIYRRSKPIPYDPTNPKHKTVCDIINKNPYVSYSEVKRMTNLQIKQIQSIIKSCGFKRVLDTTNQILKFVPLSDPRKEAIGHTKICDTSNHLKLIEFLKDHKKVYMTMKEISIKVGVEYGKCYYLMVKMGYTKHWDYMTGNHYWTKTR